MLRKYLLTKNPEKKTNLDALLKTIQSDGQLAASQGHNGGELDRDTMVQRMLLEGRILVGDEIWGRANEYYKHFKSKELQKTQQLEQQRMSNGNPNMGNNQYGSNNGNMKNQQQMNSPYNQSQKNNQQMQSGGGINNNNSYNNNYNQQMLVNDWQQQGFTTDPLAEMGEISLASWSNMTTLQQNSELGVRLNEEEKGLLASVQNYAVNAVIVERRMGEQQPQAASNGIYGENELVEAKSISTIPPGTSQFDSNWGSKNILSSRNAHARLRTKRYRDENPNNATANSNKREWKAEDVEANDTACALLSAATQEFVKTLCMEAISLSRSRQNLEGLRILHMQNPKLCNGVEPPLGLTINSDIDKQRAKVELDNITLFLKQEDLILKKIESARASQSSLVKELLSTEPKYTSTVTDMKMLSKRVHLPDTLQTGRDDTVKLGKEIRAGTKKPFGDVPAGKVKISGDDIRECVDKLEDKTGGKRIGWRGVGASISN